MCIVGLDILLYINTFCFNWK